MRLSKTQGNREIHHYGFQSADNCFTFWIDTSKKINYPSDRLVLSIINHRPFSSVECNWGIENEPRAIKSYVSYQHAKGFIEVNCSHLVKCGFCFVCSDGSEIPKLRRDLNTLPKFKAKWV